VVVPIDYKWLLPTTTRLARMPVMRAPKRFRGPLLLCLVVTSQPLQGLSQTPNPPDGQHDFDFEIGTWKTHLSRRLHPLTGSTTWVEMARQATSKACPYASTTPNPASGA
jgi:hypothetical protein